MLNQYSSWSIRGTKKFMLGQHPSRNIRKDFLKQFFRINIFFFFFGGRGGWAWKVRLGGLNQQSSQSIRAVRNFFSKPYRIFFRLFFLILFWAWGW